MNSELLRIIADFLIFLFKNTNFSKNKYFIEIINTASWMLLIISLLLIIYLIYKTFQKIIQDNKISHLNFIKTNLEITEKIQALTKDKNILFLIENYTEEIIFGKITNIYKTSKKYRDKISLLLQKFPQYNINYFISISYYLNVEIDEENNKIKKISPNIGTIDNIFYHLILFALVTI